MENIIRKYQEGILTAIAIALILLIGAIFVWGVKYLASNFEIAFSKPGESQQKVQFKTEEAKVFLQNRGLLQ